MNDSGLSWLASDKLQRPADRRQRNGTPINFASVGAMRRISIAPRLRPAGMPSPARMKVAPISACVGA